jgi:hypothetical protein
MSNSEVSHERAISHKSDEAHCPAPTQNTIKLDVYNFMEFNPSERPPVV